VFGLAKFRISEVRISEVLLYLCIYHNGSNLYTPDNVSLASLTRQLCNPTSKALSHNKLIVMLSSWSLLFS